MIDAYDPKNYPSLKLDDQWIEDIMQLYEAEWIVKKLKDCETVLDLGYGSGIIIKRLSDSKKKVTLVDAAEDFVKKANDLPNVTGVQSLFEEFEPTQKYDCVIASFILEHVQNPIRLLKKCREWSNKLIVVIGNANSIHRQVGVRMKLQQDIYSLSDRDYQVGHYMVYDYPILLSHLDKAGWTPGEPEGFFLKPVNNQRMKDWPEEMIHALNQIKLDPTLMANIGVMCD